MAGHEHRARIHRARGTAVFTDNRYGRGHTKTSVRIRLPADA